MTYCCSDIRKAYKLIEDAKSILNSTSETSGFSGISPFSIVVGLPSDFGSSEKKATEAYNILCDAQNAINDCNCGTSRDYWKNEEGKERERASNNARDYNRIVGEWRETKGKYNDLVDRFNENIADYNRLIGENKGLQERYKDLNQRFKKINDDLEESREKNEQIRTKHEEEVRKLNQDVLMLSRTEDRLRQECLGIREQLIDTRQQLTESKNKVVSLENEVRENNRQILRITETKNGEILALINQMSELRIEFGEINTQLRTDLQITQRELEGTQLERDERITPLELQELLNNSFQKDEEISSLKQRLGQSRESDLTEKIRNKEQKLQGFAHRLGIDWEQIQILRGIFNELVHYQSAGNINGVRESRTSIETVKQNLLQNRSNFDDIQEICDKCEEVARLDLQLEQQFEARVEIPANQ